jgi:hypothetical protein
MTQITLAFRTVGDRKWVSLVEQAVKRREQPLKPRKIGLVDLVTGQLVSEII